VRVFGDRSFDLVLDAAHRPFQSNESVAGCIDIKIAWVQEIPRTQGRKLFDSGTTWHLYQDEGGFQFDFGNPVSSGWLNRRLSVDLNFSNATLQMSERYFSMYPQVIEPLGYPLDELLIMHRLTQEKAIELHGAGIVHASGAANLFVGHSGAGKSTTTRLWTSREEVEVLSDDRIIVRSDVSCRNGMRMYGTPWHGEAMYASPNSAALTRIVILEHGHGNVLKLLSPSQAVAELFARSFVPFHRHEYVESALTFLEELVASVPVYRFSFEPDMPAVDTILHLRD